VTVVLDRYRHLFPDELERTTTRLQGMFVEHGSATLEVARLSS
jgi:hypothetical protein